MAKAEKIIGLMPCVYGARDRGKLLNKLIRNFAQPLDQADSHLFRIQRAHRIDVAENLNDVVRLAANLGFGTEFFTDLLEQASVADYETALKRLKARIKRLARIHLRGLGTPRAVLEAASALLDADMVANAGGGAITRLTSDGLAHQIAVRLPQRPDPGVDRIALYENPLRRVKQGFVERRPLDGWAVDTSGAAASEALFAIKGVADRTVLPSLFCSETDTGLLFNGVVPDGAVLSFDQRGRATLDGKPVDDWTVRFDGGVVGFDSVASARVAIDDGDVGEPFAGDVERLASRPARAAKKPLLLAAGRSNWHFAVARGVYQTSRSDYCVYATQPAPLASFDDHYFDQSVFDYPAHGEVGLAWDERVHCAFKLVVPQYLDGDGERQDADAAGRYANRVRRLMARFSAAGVRAYVTPDRDAWVLGQSAIRTMDADAGDGLTYRPALLWREQTDRTLPLSAA